MLVRDVMRTLPAAVDGQEPVQAVARRMLREDAGCLVVGDDRHLIGIVTDRDIALRCVAEGKNPATTPVQDIMSVGVLACRDDETIADVMDRMVRAGVLRLPVVDAEDRLVGIVSARDSVRSVPMSRLSHRRPVKVRFIKDITASYGHVHRVPIQSVYVSGTKDRQEAEAEAIERFQSDKGVADWSVAADDIEVDEPR